MEWMNKRMEMESTVIMETILLMFMNMEEMRMTSTTIREFT